MANTKEQQLQAFARRAVRASRALWPTNVRRAVATGRMAQTRRQLIVTCKYGRWSSPTLTMNAIGATALVGTSMGVLLAVRLWLLWLLFGVVVVAIFTLVEIMRMRRVRAKGLQVGAQHRSFPGVAGKAHSPDTPMPLEPPLVRVLETFDLSQTDVEHFLDLPEGGNTGGYSLENWKEAQASFPRKVRE